MARSLGFLGERAVLDQRVVGAAQSAQHVARVEDERGIQPERRLLDRRQLLPAPPFRPRRPVGVVVHHQLGQCLLVTRALQRIDDGGEVVFEGDEDVVHDRRALADGFLERGVAPLLEVDLTDQADERGNRSDVGLGPIVRSTSVSVREALEGVRQARQVLAEDFGVGGKVHRRFWYRPDPPAGGRRG